MFSTFYNMSSSSVFSYCLKNKIKGKQKGRSIANQHKKLLNVNKNKLDCHNFYFIEFTQIHFFLGRLKRPFHVRLK